MYVPSGFLKTHFKFHGFYKYFPGTWYEGNDCITISESIFVSLFRCKSYVLNPLHVQFEVKLSLEKITFLWHSPKINKITLTLTSCHHKSLLINFEYRFDLHLYDHQYIHVIEHSSTFLHLTQTFREKIDRDRHRKMQHNTWQATYIC